MPWEVLAAMDDLVFNQRKAAYSDTSAARFNVPWLSLVMDNDARLVRNTLRDFAEEGFLPEGPLTLAGESLVSETEAADRYAAAYDWFADKKHMVISNGPYMLERFDSAAQFAQLESFRDPGYPFKPGDLYYGKPPAIEVTGIEAGSIVEGRDLTATVTLEGPGELAVRYLLQDPATGQKVRSGLAQAVSGTEFQVVIPAAKVAELAGDLYYLFLAAYSDQLSTLLERKVDIEVEVDVLPNGTEPTPTATLVPPPDGDGGTSMGLIIAVVLGAAAIIGVVVVVLALRPGRRTA